MARITTLVLLVAALGLSGAPAAAPAFAPASALAARVALAPVAAPAARVALAPAPVSLAGEPERAVDTHSAVSLVPDAVVAPVGRWAWPVGPPHPVLRGFDPPDLRWGAGHRGVDLGAAVGSPVLAPTDGVVTFAGQLAGRPVLVIGHPGGLRSTFEPVVATVAVGTPVGRGAVVGTVDPTPGHCAPATCVHWGVLRGTAYLDPLALLNGRVILLPMR